MTFHFLSILFFTLVFFQKVVGKNTVGAMVKYFGDTECNYVRHEGFYINNTITESWEMSGQMGYKEIVIVKSMEDLRAEVGGMVEKAYDIGTCYDYFPGSGMTFMFTGIKLTKVSVKWYRYFYKDSECKEIGAVSIRGDCVLCKESYRRGCVEGDDNVYELHYESDDCTGSVVKKDLIEKKCDGVNWSIDSCETLL